jgi:hypothetical protein
VWDRAENWYFWRLDGAAVRGAGAAGVHQGEAAGLVPGGFCFVVHVLAYNMKRVMRILGIGELMAAMRA